MVRLDGTHTMEHYIISQMALLSFSLIVKSFIGCTCNHSHFLLQIIVWNVDGWEKQKCRFLQFPAPVALTDTYVQFHQDQINFLAFNKSHLAIYEAKKLECLKQVSTFSLI